MAKILIVDDVVENARILASLVQDLGEVVFATDGEAALALSAQHGPDLVLLDATMPGMHAHEICRRLHEAGKTKKAAVILVSGPEAEADEAAGLGAGAIDCISRPFAPALVRARVRHHLALVRALEDLRVANEALQHIALTDPLTGLANRRRIIEVGTQELLRAQRTSTAAGVMCALVIDIDHFRKINESHGQPAGDAVIQEVARICSQGVRAIDTVGRLGGEEFAIVLPMTDCRGGVELADRLRDRVAAASIASGNGQPLRATVSVGVAQGTSKTRSFEALLSAADQALRRAKRAGRNRVAATIYGVTEERQGSSPPSANA